MSTALFFTSGFPEGPIADLDRACGPRRSIIKRDLYSFDDIDLTDVAALLIGMHVDQRFLATRADQLDLYLRQGGTIVANGQFAYPFLAGVSLFRPLQAQGLGDLTIHREAAHPIWHDVTSHDLTFRRGVAGFYGRGWHEMPRGAMLINSIGPAHQPVDFTYRVGAGRVLVHGGNDVWQFARPGETTRELATRLLDWVFVEDGST